MTMNKTILLVDDDVDALEQLSLVLSAAGYNVRTAYGQSEAEELLLSVRPDLAILDLMMEHMDSGLVLCRNLKKLYPQTPVIMLTAVAGATGMTLDAPTKEARSWLMADTILDKPARPEQIIAEIKRLLREPAAKGGAHAH
jgi:DNA-binding response OmpR family regulator